MLQFVIDTDFFLLCATNGGGEKLISSRPLSAYATVRCRLPCVSIRSLATPRLRKALE